MAGAGAGWGNPAPTAMVLCRLGDCGCRDGVPLCGAPVAGWTSSPWPARRLRKPASLRSRPFCPTPSSWRWPPSRGVRRGDGGGNPDRRPVGRRARPNGAGAAGRRTASAAPSGQGRTDGRRQACCRPAGGRGSGRGTGAGHVGEAGPSRPPNRARPSPMLRCCRLPARRRCRRSRPRPATPRCGAGTPCRPRCRRAGR